jgi:hypothetical protein
MTSRASVAKQTAICGRRRLRAALLLRREAASRAPTPLVAPLSAKKAVDCAEEVPCIGGGPGVDGIGGAGGPVECPGGQSPADGGMLCAGLACGGPPAGVYGPGVAGGRMAMGFGGTDDGGCAPGCVGGGGGCGFGRAGGSGAGGIRRGDAGYATSWGGGWPFSQASYAALALGSKRHAFAPATASIRRCHSATYKPGAMPRIRAVRRSAAWVMTRGSLSQSPIPSSS